MTDTVIITANSHSNNDTYHTDVCRKVWQITRREYISESDARQRGYEECTYCAGEYETSNGDDGHYQALVREAEKRRAGAD